MQQLGRVRLNVLLERNHTLDYRPFFAKFEELGRLRLDGLPKIKKSGERRGRHGIFGPSRTSGRSPIANPGGPICEDVGDLCMRRLDAPETCKRTNRPRRTGHAAEWPSRGAPAWSVSPANRSSRVRTNVRRPSFLFARQLLRAARRGRDGDLHSRGVTTAVFVRRVLRGYSMTAARSKSKARFKRTQNHDSPRMFSKLTSGTIRKVGWMCLYSAERSR